MILARQGTNIPINSRPTFLKSNDARQRDPVMLSGACIIIHRMFSSERGRFIVCPVLLRHVPDVAHIATPPAPARQYPTCSGGWLLKRPWAPWRLLPLWYMLIVFSFCPPVVYYKPYFFFCYLAKITNRGSVGQKLIHSLWLLAPCLIYIV